MGKTDSASPRRGVHSDVRRRSSSENSPSVGIPDWVWLLTGVLILALAFGIGYPMVKARRAISVSSSASSPSATATPSATLASSVPAGMKAATNKNVTDISLPTKAGGYALSGSSPMNYAGVREKATYSGTAGTVTLYRDAGDPGNATTAMSNRHDYDNYRCGVISGEMCCLTLAQGGFFWAITANNATTQQTLPEFMASFASQI